MKTYLILSESTIWSMKSLRKKVENILNERTKEGYEVVSVAFGINLWGMPTAFITVCK